ncbi:signal peptidase I [Aeromicrobium sp. CTD01-1L150]|uniref:signal peptidase I n=1 Tax=Aeromicrobium sp. CTD01-1L150 TaxID=3341830 RepID=UPI0035BFCF78
MTSTHQRRPARIAREVVLWTGAVLGTLSIILVLLAVVFDVKPLVFRSGSMEPAIGTGALAVAREIPADRVEVDDVVSVIADDGTRITHRVVAIGEEDGEVSLTLQGDANSAPDAEAYPVTTVDRVLVDVPYTGYALSALGSPSGMFACGLLVATALFLGFGRRPDDTGAAAQVRTLVILAGLAGLMVPAARPGDTLAQFTDDATMTSGNVQAHTVSSQAQPTCTDVNGVLVLGNLARLTWPQADARYEYLWQLRRSDNDNLVASGVVGTGAAAGSTVTLDISTGLIGVNTNYDVVVRARLSNNTSWVASTATTTPVRRASVVIIGTAFRCGHT